LTLQELPAVEAKDDISIPFFWSFSGKIPSLNHSP